MKGKSQERLLPSQPCTSWRSPGPHGTALALLLLPLLAGLSPPVSARGLRGRRLGSIRDDPHFSSPTGVPYDFHGEPDTAYCMLTDTRLHVNAMLRGYKDKRPFGASAPDAKGMKTRTWMKELGFIWLDASGGTHTLHLAVRVSKQSARGAGYLAKVTLDGKGLRLPYDGKAVEQAGLHFQFMGVATQEKPREEQEQFELSINNEIGATLVIRPANPQLQTKTDAEVHFNLNTFFLNSTGRVHGILGQTYRDSRQEAAKLEKWGSIAEQTGKAIQADQASGRGFLDGAVKDYVSSSVTKPDCHFSQFGKK